MANPRETNQDVAAELNQAVPADSVQGNPTGSSAKTFTDVFQEELLDLKNRRTLVGVEPWQEVELPNTDPEWKRMRALRRRAFENNLFGVALSGGGIRSATFCLGVLQALAQSRLIRRVDYLSTVSGGGYIGAWLAAWIKRDGNVQNVEKQLHPSHLIQARAKRWEGATDQVLDDEPEAVRHLRAYSNYLAPHPGLFSADGWVLIAIFLRNFLLNQIVLCSALLTLLFAVFLIVMLFAAVPSAILKDGGWSLLARGEPDRWTHLTTAPSWLLLWVGVPSLLALMIACFTIDRGLREVSSALGAR